MRSVHINTFNRAHKYREHYLDKAGDNMPSMGFITPGYGRVNHF